MKQRTQKKMANLHVSEASEAAAAKKETHLSHTNEQTHNRRAEMYAETSRETHSASIQFYWNFVTTSQNMDFVVSFKMPLIQ